MTTVEGNKLIAEFDDAMKLDESDPKKESWNSKYGWFHASQLQYHSSWDCIFDL